MTEATRATWTGPWAAVDAVPRFVIWNVGAIVSPGCITEGTSSAVVRSSGNACEMNRTGNGRAQSCGSQVRFREPVGVIDCSRM